MIRMITEFKVPTRHILRPTLSTNMVKRVLQWERQKRCYARKKARAHGTKVML